MKKLYEKSELTFAIVCIVVYCVLQSLANTLNEVVGTAYSASAVFCILQAVILFVFIWKNGLMERYGLCRSLVGARRFLYYVPLVLLAAGNLWNGAVMNETAAGTVCRIVCMLCVGFIEELIFRGILFRAIAEEHIKRAVIISSVTFGAGHLVNLVNGSGMEWIENLCQVVFAVVVGFLFVTLFYRGGSLLPCVLTHSMINSLAAFANDNGVTAGQRVIQCLVMTVAAAAYALILERTLPEAVLRGDENIEMKGTTGV